MYYILKLTFERQRISKYFNFLSENRNTIHFETTNDTIKVTVVKLVCVVCTTHWPTEIMLR